MFLSLFLGVTWSCGIPPKGSGAMSCQKVSSFTPNRARSASCETARTSARNLKGILQKKSRSKKNRERTKRRRRSIGEFHCLSCPQIETQEIDVCIPVHVYIQLQTNSQLDIDTYRQTDVDRPIATIDTIAYISIHDGEKVFLNQLLTSPHILIEIYLPLHTVEQSDLHRHPNAYLRDRTRYSDAYTQEEA